MFALFFCFFWTLIISDPVYKKTSRNFASWPPPAQLGYIRGTITVAAYTISPHPVMQYVLGGSLGKINRLFSRDISPCWCS